METVQKKIRPAPYYKPITLVCDNCGEKQTYTHQTKEYYKHYKELSNRFIYICLFCETPSLLREELRKKKYEREKEKERIEREERERIEREEKERIEREEKESIEREEREREQKAREEELRIQEIKQREAEELLKQERIQHRINRLRADFFSDGTPFFKHILDIEDMTMSLQEKIVSIQEKNDNLLNENEMLKQQLTKVGTIMHSLSNVFTVAKP